MIIETTTATPSPVSAFDGVFDAIVKAVADRILDQVMQRVEVEANISVVL